MIPRVIHQMAKNARSAERWAAFSDRVRSFHPKWEYRLWTEADCRKLVSEKEHQLLAAFDLLPQSVMRADVARMVILREFGGLYLDLDYEMLRPFDLLRHRLVLPKARSLRMGDRADLLGTSIMASEAAHPFWDLALKRFKERPPISLATTRHRATGKQFLTRVYEEEIAATSLRSTVATPERPLFHPPTPHSDADYRSIVEERVAYGIHHCHDATQRRRIPRKVRAFLRALLPEYA
ncbi:MAG: glycosyltransferase [Opitutaceae bacterium]|nr:glycosyltransferase [Opitutaceae bacterium]